jgi:hypothetical protein
MRPGHSRRDGHRAIRCYSSPAASFLYYTSVVRGIRYYPWPKHFNRSLVLPERSFAFQINVF